MYLLAADSRKYQKSKLIINSIIVHHIEHCITEGCLLLKGFPEANFLNY